MRLCVFVAGGATSKAIFLCKNSPIPTQNLVSEYFPVLRWAMFSRLRKEDGFGGSLGVFATVGQVLLMREALGLSGGNELTVGLSLAAWLAGVGVGASLAGRLLRPRSFVFFAAIGGCCLMGLGVVALRLHRRLLGLLPGSDPLLLQLVLLVIVCLLAGGLVVGFLFTTVARGTGSGSENPVSRLYVAEGIGAVVGGILFSFVLSARLWHLDCLLLVGMGLLGTASWISMSRAQSWVAKGLSLICLLLVVGGIGERADNWLEKEAFSNFIAGGKIVSRGYSHYGRVTLGRAQEQFFLLRDGRLDHVFPDPWDRPFVVHLALSAHRSPQRVLLVGGGPSDRLSHVLAHNPEKVVLTYTDGSVHDLCLPHWSSDVREALADPRVRVIKTDGRRFVSDSEERFDVIIVATEAIRSSGANRYHTREFFTAVKGVLRDGGILSVLSPGGANMLAPEAARVTASERLTLRAVFPEVIAVPGEVVTLLATTRPGSLPSDSEELMRRFLSHGADVSGFSPRRFPAVFAKGRLAALDRQLSQTSSLTTNSDNRPFAYLAGLQLWERSVSREGATADDTLLGWAEQWAIWALFFPLAMGALWIWRVRPRSIAPPSLAIAGTGAAGMAMEVTALYVYQGTSGQLYSGMALLIALFMAGLSAGAFWAHRLRDTAALGKSVGVECGVLLMLVCMGPVLDKAFEAAWVVWFWSALSGTVTGAAFPILMGRAARIWDGDQRTVAAVIESADHYGASFGALVSGVLWLPVYGVAAVGLLFAALKAITLAGVFWPFRSGHRRVSD